MVVKKHLDPGPYMEAAGMYWMGWQSQVFYVMW